MLYRNLVQFEDLQSVVQLRDADALDDARRLVQTYVISDRMADVLTHVILPQLRFERPADQKGILIVGNYGTGKSHLMSVLSAVAEHAGLAADLRHPGVAEAAVDGVAGRFLALRTEIGGTQMPLRDIVFRQLEAFLGRHGIDVRFPAATEVPNNKDPLLAMLARFEDVYPGQGLLLVVDEMLDYLRTRKEMDLVYDLNFMREIGEVARISRLRFVGGVQEALFDSPHFQFVADTMWRVRDRYEQVRLTRTDVAFVVAERLLRKSPEQRAWIHRYLERFAPLYPALSERLDDYVRLFPVHPRYLEVFEQLSLIEQRQALKALSQSMRARLDDPVPDTEPGLIAYDDYWATVRHDPALRANPDVRQVVDTSKVLEERVRAAYTHPTLKPMALRIIHGLSLLRLTTGDITAPLGATAEELRDGLSLYAPMPEQTPDFLLTSVENALRGIYTTVSGQFISYNRENGQYFLDVRKVVDYDALIDEKARSLSENRLDHYYFEALKRVMECTDSTYVPGARIWFHEVSWPGRRVTRPGYLFFGAPNERSTAQPPRDFYLYFLQPYEPPPYDDPQLQDEVFFRLTSRDDDFESALRVYAGARELEVISSGDTKANFANRGANALSRLQKWLRENMPRTVEVTHQGVTKPLAEWERETPRPGEELSIREIVNAVGSVCLAPGFASRYPEYPTFRGLRNDISEESRPKQAQEAIRWLTGARGQIGQAILDGLELLEDGQVRPRHSRYARALLERLGPHVLNRSALLETYAQVEKEPRFKLEPDWLMVVILALVYSGDAVLNVGGERIDAATLSRAAALPMDALKDFKFVEKPRETPVAAWEAVFELLGLPPGQIRDTDPKRRDDAIQNLQRAVDAELTSVVRALDTLRHGVHLWQEPVLEAAHRDRLSQSLGGYKDFLESLRIFNTPGKLRNLQTDEPTIRAFADARRDLRQVAQLVEWVNALQPLAAYFREAEAVLPRDDALVKRIEDLRRSQLQRLRDSRPDDAALRQTLQRELETLRGDTIEVYRERHDAARLTQAEEDRRQRLLVSLRVKRLGALQQVKLLGDDSLDKTLTGLRQLRACWKLTPTDLRHRAVCPHCDYRPSQGAEPARARLDAADRTLEQMETRWRDALLAELARPDVQANIALLDPEARSLLAAFRDRGALPDHVTPAFTAAVNQALQQLETLRLDGSELWLALAEAGPCSPEEFRARFDRYVGQKLAGHDPEHVRISLDW